MSVEDVALEGDEEFDEEVDQEGEEGLVENDGFDTEDSSWQAAANCLGVDPDLFFPERGASTRDAKDVCRGCVVREFCLEYALAKGEKFGIWGGLSERERRRIRRRRSIERKAGTYSYVPPVLVEADSKAFRTPKLGPKQPVASTSEPPRNPAPSPVKVGREVQQRLVQFLVDDGNFVVVSKTEDVGEFANRFGLSFDTFFTLLAVMMGSGWIDRLEEDEQVAYIVTADGLEEFPCDAVSSTAVQTQDQSPEQEIDQRKVGPAMATYDGPEDLDQQERDVLQWLADKGPVESSSGQATGELADQLALDKKELSPIISAFVKEGLVDRDGTQRPRRLAITDLGRQWLSGSGGAGAATTPSAPAPAEGGSAVSDLGELDADYESAEGELESAMGVVTAYQQAASSLIEGLQNRVRELEAANEAVTAERDELKTADEARQAKLAALRAEQDRLQREANALE